MTEGFPEEVVCPRCHCKELHSSEHAMNISFIELDVLYGHVVSRLSFKRELH